MKQQLKNNLAALPLAALLLFACNRIDYAGCDGEPVATQNATAAQSVAVTQDEAKELADLFRHSEIGTTGVATKSAENSSFWKQLSILTGRYQNNTSCKLSKKRDEQ